MISGFMPIKNVLGTGYPFVEAIAASLPVCDEFLVSDGYSTDGTFEVIEKIATLNKKVRVFRQQWPTSKEGSVLAEVTNAVRVKCRYNYILSIQANEIIHEDSVEYIKALPEICPTVGTFGLPFIHLARNRRFYEDFRVRFAKNNSNIVAVSDAWTLGTTDSFNKSEIFKGIRHQKRFLQYLYKGIEWTYANQCESPLSRAIYLPKPIFRYWSLFPSDYLEKSQRRMDMFGVDLKFLIEALKNEVDNPSVFWRKAAKMQQKLVGFHYPDALELAELDDNPKVIKGLLEDPSLTEYRVREEVLNSIRDL